jgi:hypothetical protein
MTTKKPVKTTVNKSAITGKFVSNKIAKANPNTTYKQTVVKQPNKSK